VILNVKQYGLLNSPNHGSLMILDVKQYDLLFNSPSDVKSYQTTRENFDLYEATEGLFGSLRLTTSF
jgi:hypothetical protein